MIGIGYGNERLSCLKKKLFTFLLAQTNALDSSGLGPTFIMFIPMNYCSCWWKGDNVIT